MIHITRLIFLLTILLASTLYAATPASWEAESGRISGPAILIKDSSASDGAALHISPNGRVEWTVEAPAAGRYELNFRHLAKAIVWLKLEVNGRVRGMGMGATFGEWHETAQTVTLRAGANSIALIGANQEFSLDLVHFTMLPAPTVGPLYEIPEISPHRARVDLRAPQPLLFLLRRNGHALSKVSLADHEFTPAYVDYPAIDDAVQMSIPAAVLSQLTAGRHRLHVTFADGAEVSVPVDAGTESLAAPLLIASLDVWHGKATLLRLPDGQVALIDCASAEYAQSRLLPFLAAHGIKRIDQLFITHYHTDHMGGLELLKSAVPIGAFHDYKSYRTGEKFELGGAEWFVLNAYDTGADENSRSLSLQITYRGFIYTDGADNYGANQRVVLQKFPERVRSHVYYGNHHFHGSVDVNYLRRTDPMLVLVSAEAGVYARTAYTDDYTKEVAGYLKSHNGRLQDTLLTAEIGNTVIRVHDADHWTYETLPIGAVFPDFLLPPK